MNVWRYKQSVILAAFLVAIGVSIVGFWVLEGKNIRLPMIFNVSSLENYVAESEIAQIEWEMKVEIEQGEAIGEIDLNIEVLDIILSELNYPQRNYEFRVLGTVDTIRPTKVVLNLKDINSLSEAERQELNYPVKAGAEYFSGIRVGNNGDEMLIYELFINPKMLPADWQVSYVSITDLILQVLVLSSYSDREVNIEETYERVDEFKKRYEQEGGLLSTIGWADRANSFLGIWSSRLKLVKPVYADCQGRVQCGTGVTNYQCEDGNSCPPNQLDQICGCKVPLVGGLCPAGQDAYCRRESECIFNGNIGPCMGVDKPYCTTQLLCDNCSVSGTECYWVGDPPPPPRPSDVKRPAPVPGTGKPT